MVTSRALGVVLALSLLPACAFKRVCPRIAKEAERPTSATAVAYLKFLGVAGFLIEYDGVAVLTAPMYSNPTLGEIATQAVHTDHRLIDELLPDVKSVGAILSGHSHYDHLMDVPYIALEKARQATIYGNDEMERLLAPLSAPGQGLRNRLMSLERRAREDVERLRHQTTPCADSTAYEPVGADKRLRIWPIVSEHSSQFTIPVLGKLLDLPPVHLWRGRTLQPAKDLPRTPSDWVEGTTLSYLVDFMSRDDPKRVALRVYYQDSGSRDPYGFPPKCLLAERGVDVAILTAGASAMLKRHPTQIVAALQPSFVVASHWEDFFNPRELPLPGGVGTNGCCETIRGAPLQKPKKFLDALARALPAGGQYSMPCPDAWTLLEPTDSGAGRPWKLRASSGRWYPASSARRRD